jgi:hypothetical protein
MRSEFRIRRWWVLTMTCAAATLFSGCSKLFSLAVENHYSQAIRVYCDSVSRIPRETKLLGEVPPLSGTRFNHVLNELDPVWHIIVKDRGARTVDDIKADGDAIRAMRRSRKNDHTWHVSAGPVKSFRTARTVRGRK